ncbi:hypothetical protein PMIN06_003365 [Paraphaeosphaeria minitans]|uniref:Benzoate 4-monooxygenase cytochrome p450 n=1 Tax=Paraphaeosphaeria minitans TaxID=565426 RepID=A0A9P6GUC1_9PLEO|nr:benzoate 4-monooxygenase cytochrome p450 [Paraphaeosphaeria minitans]
MEIPQNASVPWHGEPLQEGHSGASLLLRAVLALLVASSIGQVVYNLYLHPLKDIPGPLLARGSLLWRFRYCMGGHWHLHIQKAHKRYGDVIRVSPNELSFASAKAWKSVYGIQKGAPITKNEFWDMIGLGFDEGSIGSERDYHLAAQKRDLFADAMSNRNVAQQEPILQAFVSLFLDKMGNLGDTKEGLDMGQWFLYFGFDVGTKMAFGESFECLVRESAHEWLTLVLPLFFFVNIADNFRRIPLVVPLLKLIPMGWLRGVRGKIVKYSKDQTAKRLLRSGPQNDFFDNCVDKVQKGDVSEEEMASHLFTFSVAAGETQATSMTGILYNLLANPEKRDELQREVRGAYKSTHDMDVATLLKLPYLQAVLKEGMRIHPAVPQGLPRVSPGTMIEGIYVPEGTEVYVSAWSTSHDERYFHDPYTFKPERWIDPTCQDVKEASQPFGLGPRVCPGKRLAFAQMSMQLAKMVYTYDMELLDSSRDWNYGCKTHYFWWMPPLNVRFRPRANVGA